MDLGFEFAKEAENCHPLMVGKRAYGTQVAAGARSSPKTALAST